MDFGNGHYTSALRRANDHVRKDNETVIYRLAHVRLSPPPPPLEYCKRAPPSVFVSRPVRHSETVSTVSSYYFPTRLELETQHASVQSIHCPLADTRCGIRPLRPVARFNVSNLSASPPPPPNPRQAYVSLSLSLFLSFALFSLLVSGAQQLMQRKLCRVSSM